MNYKLKLLLPTGILIVMGVCGAAAGVPDVVHMVSQQGRAFRPLELTIKQGETVQIVNDDGDLLHHAYIDSPDFSFDSGDQAPGSRTNVVFSKRGVFTVLCGIHPKMKMVVTVQD